MSEEQNTSTPSDVPSGNYRKLSQPPDTISGATQDLLEVRPSGTASGDADGSALGFKIIAVIAIVVLIGAIVATQLGILQ